MIKHANKVKENSHPAWYHTALRVAFLVGFVIASAFFVNNLLVHNTYADSSDGAVIETTFFGNLRDDGKGCGVFTVLNLVVDILSMGIGILGIIGITVAGIQYLTASGKEEQVRKSRQRIAEIVIGIVAYVLIYAALQWLLPGGKLNSNVTCSTVSDSELATIRREQAAERRARLAASANKTNQSTSSKNKTSNSNNTVDASKSWGERIAQTAKLLAAKSNYHHNYSGSELARFKKWSDLKRAKPAKEFMTAIDKVWPKHGFKSRQGIGADCGVFVNVVLSYSGHDKKKAKNTKIQNKMQSYFEAHPDKWTNVTGKKLKPGDVCVKNWTDANGGSRFHGQIYLGKNKKGKNIKAEAGNHSQNFGHIANGGCSGYKVYRAK